MKRLMLPLILFFGCATLSPGRGPSQVIDTVIIHAVVDTEVPNADAVAMPRETYFSGGVID